MTRAHLGHARVLHAAGLCRAAGKAVAEAWLRAEFEAVDAVKADAERPLARAYADLLDRQRDAVMDALPGALASVRSLKQEDDPEVVGALLLSVADWLDDIEAEFGPLVADALEEGFLTGALRLGAGDLQPDVTDGARAVLSEVVSRIQGTTATTQAEVGRIIVAGIEAGDTVTEIADALGAKFDDWKAWRAELVAEDVTQAVFERGQVEAYRAGGVDRKRWLTQRDSEVRETHVAADGQEVGLDEPFVVGGYECDHPGDPVLPASESIRCRCSSLPVTTEKKAPTWRDERDAAIRAAYPALRDAEGQTGALATLAERHSVSERTVRRALWE
ncbi:MAG: phage minor head protein [Bacteroidota bacterium]